MVAERAGYTVTMFLVDISPSMGKLRKVQLPDGPGGEIRTTEMTNLQWALQFVLLKIQEMIYNGRKTDQCGVILFGTEETANIVNNRAGGYDHVTEFIPIGQPSANTLAKLQALQPSSVIGDPIDAIIVGIETQDAYLAKKKTWTRKMVILTDGENPMEVEDWELTTKKMNDLNIITTIIGVDFDDEEFGFQEEDKSDFKRTNEEFFQIFVSKLSNGVLGTCAFALQECVRPDSKQVKSALTGTVLRLGDVEARPEEAIEVTVKMSKCTAIARPPPMKKFAKRIKEGADEDSAENEELEGAEDVYAQLAIQTEYVAHKNKPEDEDEGTDAEGTKSGGDNTKIVGTDELVRGFKYGASYVPCPDGQFTRLPTLRGFDICGFFPNKHFRRDYAMGEVSYVWADPGSGASQLAISSVVQAMLERNVLAIARYVSRDGMDPKMGVLVPRAFEEVDCFLWTTMPFADDVRRYAFPSLTNLVNKKGEKVENHAYLPTEEQEEAMEKFVASMDLMQAGDKDENGDRLPWFDPRESYNPSVHRIKQALFHAAIVTDLRTNPLPPPHPEVVKYFEPPRRVLKRAHSATEECKNIFKIKQVPKRVARPRKGGHARAEEEGDDLLLLDDPSSNSNLTNAVSQVGQSQEPASSATLVEPQKVANTKKEERMDIDSETEPEEDGDELVRAMADRPSNGEAARLHMPTPQPSLLDISGSQTQSQSQSQSQSQNIGLDDGRAPGRIIGTAQPLRDFRSNVKQGDLVTKAVEDLAFVIKDIVLKPFASRRQSEMIDCMVQLRETCLTEDEIDAWNTFLRELKEACLSNSVVHNKAFWKAIQTCSQHVGLISDTEAQKFGGGSNVTDNEAGEFMRS